MLSGRRPPGWQQRRRAVPPPPQHAWVLLIGHACALALAFLLCGAPCVTATATPGADRDPTTTPPQPSACWLAASPAHEPCCLSSGGLGPSARRAGRSSSTAATEVRTPPLLHATPPQRLPGQPNRGHRTPETKLWLPRCRRHGRGSRAVAAATGKPGRKSTKQMLEQPVEQASTSYSTQLPPELASRTNELTELMLDPQNLPDSLLADDATGAQLCCLCPASLAGRSPWLHCIWAGLPASWVCGQQSRSCPWPLPAGHGAGHGAAACLCRPCMCLSPFAPQPQGLVRLSGCFHAGRTVTSLAQPRLCRPARRAVMARRRPAPRQLCSRPSLGSPAAAHPRSLAGRAAWGAAQT